jgi:hypothetical protein
MTPRLLRVGEDPPPMLTEAEIERTASRRPKPKGKAGNRFAVMNAFIDFTMAGLPHPCRSVWVVLWRDTRPDGLARTAQADIARRIGMSVSTVKRAVRELELLGLLTVAYRGGLGGRLSVYRVNPLPRDRSSDPLQGS